MPQVFYVLENKPKRETAMTPYQRFVAQRRASGMSFKEIGRAWQKEHGKAPVSRNGGKPVKRNPGRFLDGLGILEAAQTAVTKQTVKHGLGVLGGAIVASGAPSLMPPSWNRGFLGLVLTIGTAAIAGIATAMLMPEMAVSVAAGGIVVAGIRTIAHFVPRALEWRPSPTQVQGYLPAPRPPQVAGYLPAPANAISQPPVRVQGLVPATRAIRR